MRLEVRSLQQSNPDQWNLYLLGLDALHNNTNESESLSYFQIAGRNDVISVLMPLVL